MPGMKDWLNNYKAKKVQVKYNKDVETVKEFRQEIESMEIPEFLVNYQTPSGEEGELSYYDETGERNDKRIKKHNVHTCLHQSLWSNMGVVHRAIALTWLTQNIASQNNLKCPKFDFVAHDSDLVTVSTEDTNTYLINIKQFYYKISKPHIFLQQIVKDVLYYDHANKYIDYLNNPTEENKQKVNFALIENTRSQIRQPNIDFDKVEAGEGTIEEERLYALYYNQPIYKMERKAFELVMEISENVNYLVDNQEDSLWIGTRDMLKNTYDLTDKLFFKYVNAKTTEEYYLAIFGGVNADVRKYAKEYDEPTEVKVEVPVKEL